MCGEQKGLPCHLLALLLLLAVDVSQNSWWSALGDPNRCGVGNTCWARGAKQVSWRRACMAVAGVACMALACVAVACVECGARAMARVVACTHAMPRACGMSWHTWHGIRMYAYIYIHRYIQTKPKTQKHKKSNNKSTINKVGYV